MFSYADIECDQNSSVFRVQTTRATFRVSLFDGYATIECVEGGDYYFPVCGEYTLKD